MANRNDVILVGAIAGGLYLLYRALTGLGSRAAGAISDTASSASSATADLLEQLFPHKIGNTVFPPGTTIVLGDGTEVPASSVAGVGAFTDVDNVQKFQFYYAGPPGLVGGHTYRTTSIQPDSTGTYYASNIN